MGEPIVRMLRSRGDFLVKIRQEIWSPSRTLYLTGVNRPTRGIIRALLLNEQTAAWGRGAGSVAGGAALGWNARGNVDLRLGGGYGTGGPSAAALLTVALR
jgi:hypothetical protein